MKKRASNYFKITIRALSRNLGITKPPLTPNMGYILIIHMKIRLIGHALTVKLMIGSRLSYKFVIIIFVRPTLYFQDKRDPIMYLMMHACVLPPTLYQRKKKW